MSAEKRGEPRKTADQRCWIDGGGGRPPIPCWLSDISSTGAKLSCDEIAKLPDRFNLYLTTTGSVGRQCSVAWRKGEEIGVRFESREVPAPGWLDSKDDPVTV